MSFTIKTFKTSDQREIQICIAPPHQFLLKYQQQLLPAWDTPVVTVILCLQQSAISLEESNHEVTQQKEQLRIKFIHWGCNLVHALQAQGYRSDLFDPRNGYPWFSSPGKLTFDDSAAVHALLHFPLKKSQNCSLIEHPTWKHNIYPGTVVTDAPPTVAKLWSEKGLIG